MSSVRMERSRRSKTGSLSGLSGGLPSGAASGAGNGTGSVRRQRSLEWGDRYSSSDDDRPPQPPPLADRVFASLLAQATQQFDDEQRRIYGSETEELPRFVPSPQRQSSPFPHESTNRRFYRRNRNSKGEEIFAGEAAGGTLSRRGRRSDEYTIDNGARNGRMALNNGTSGSGGQSERECESPPEPAPPEVPPRGPSLHVTLRHRATPCDPPGDSDRLYLSEEFVIADGAHAGYARSPMSSSTTGHSSSSHHSPQ